MKQKYEIKSDPENANISILNTETQKTVEISNWEEGLEFLETLISSGGSDGQEYAHLLRLLQNLTVWYVTKQPLFPKGLDGESFYDLVYRLGLLSSRTEELYDEIDHKIKWYSRAEDRPFIFFDKENEGYRLLIDDSEYVIFTTLEHCRQGIPEIAQEENWAPEILAKVLKDLEPNTKNTPSIGIKGVDLRISKYRTN